MKFIKDGHKYIRNGKRYQSVSKFSERYIEPFDEETISKYSAKKMGVSQEYVLEMWHLKRDISINYGNAIHKAVEYEHKFGKMPDHKHLKIAVKAFKKLLKQHSFTEWESEKMVWNDKLRIAGTIDNFIHLGDKEVVIWDIKTNGNIHKKGYGKLLEPFEDLEANDINKYKVKMTIYKLLAESMGWKVKGLGIPYWSDNKFELIEFEPLKIKLKLK